jgi:hypothetical protein
MREQSPVGFRFDPIRDAAGAIRSGIGVRERLGCTANA